MNKKRKITIKEVSIKSIIISLPTGDHEITVEDARILRDKLDDLLGKKEYIPFVPYASAPVVPPENPWGEPYYPPYQPVWSGGNITCGETFTMLNKH